MRSKQTRLCERCNNPYHPNYRVKGQPPQRFCSQICEKIARFGPPCETACETCGKPAKSTGRRKQKYCSPECRFESQRGRRLGTARRERMSLSHKQREWTPERAAQLKAALKARKFSPETREKIRAARLRQDPQPKTNTSIELMMQDALSIIGIHYVTQKPLCGICIPDILLPDHQVAIFVDGSYWHSLPKTVERDTRYNAELPKQGWLPIRVSENSVRSDALACAREIQRLLSKPLNRDAAIFL